MNHISTLTGIPLDLASLGDALSLSAAPSLSESKGDFQSVLLVIQASMLVRETNMYDETLLRRPS